MYIYIYIYIYIYMGVGAMHIGECVCCSKKIIQMSVKLS